MPRPERRLVSLRSSPFEFGCEAEPLGLFADRAAPVRVGGLLETANEGTDGVGRRTGIGDIGRERLQRASGRRGCREENDLVKIRVVDEDGVEGRTNRRLGEGRWNYGRRCSPGQGCDPTIDRRSSSVGGFQGLGVREGSFVFSRGAGVRLGARTRAFARSVVLQRVGFSLLLCL